VRFSWIEEEWDRAYQRKAKDIILKLVSTIYHYASYQLTLVQMSQYHGPLSSTPAIVRKSKPAPVVKGGTRFRLEHPVREKNTTPSTSTVDSEYEKYASGKSADGTDILQFWEVRFR
jgi:hypothetical protein